MIGYVYKQVIKQMKRLIDVARYMTMIIDEVTIVDNNSLFMSIHAYIIEDRVKVLLLVSL